MTRYRHLTYDTSDEGRIARIMFTLPVAATPRTAGCSSSRGDAFLRAEAGDDVRVVILGRAGPAISSGHDVGTPGLFAEMRPGPAM